MKYPKVLRILAIAAAVSMAAPGVVISTHASETTETPQEYAARTGYVLPEGYHYMLNGEYVILDDNGMPFLEADPAPEPVAPEIPAEPVASEIPAEPAVPESPAEPEIPEEPEEPEEPAEPEIPETSETPAQPEIPAEPETPEESEIPGTPGDGSENGGNAGSGETDDKTGDADKGGKDKKDETDASEEIGDKTNTGAADENQGGEPVSDESGIGMEQPAVSESAGILGVFSPEKAPSENKYGRRETEVEPFFMTSAQFKALHDRIQYNVEVPIDGLPSFVTQEMIVGALKAQDETGYPASVTIAQIIQESGYGQYGPGGEDGKGLSYLAFEYCNLFGIKGIGTAGNVSMKTSEMEEDGSVYSTYAGFRVYNTYTECIEDRSELLEEVYSDLTENVTDANTFAMKVGKRWATDINYGKHLINTMRRYELYRLDDMTLSDFTEMVGEFANPCPGSTITSLFGRREAPIAGATTYHKGLDMGTGAYNIPTYAAKAGTVVFVGEAGACGNMITIDHGDGLVTKYMHHAAVFVKEGDTVEQGQQIGLSGTTGNSTGNHLHFQVEENGVAVDPLRYLQASAEEAETAKEAYVEKQAKAVDTAKEARIRLLKDTMKEKLNF